VCLAIFHILYLIFLLLILILQ